MPRAVFIHGAGDPHAPLGSAHLAARLQRELSPGLEIAMPEMPEPEEPTCEAWEPAIGDAIDDAGPGAILIAHSFGASTLLRHLCERDSPIGGMFLVATPWWAESFPEFGLPDDCAERLPQPDPTFLYHSREDPEVPFAHLAEFERLFPRATVRALEGGDHSFVDGLPALAEDLRRLAD